MVTFFSQLNSPNHVLNPKYVKHLNETAQQLSSTESEAMKGFKFLKGLKDMGVEDLSVLQEQVRAVIDIDKTLKQIQDKLSEIEKTHNSHESSK